MGQENPLQVGSRIRAIRESQNLSLRALAEKSGLSVNAISLIERGENSPTVTSLHMLATALDVPITDFFQSPSGLRVAFLEPDKRMQSAANGVVMESLGIGLRQQQMEPFLITLQPGTGTYEQPVAHSGEEFAYCLAGRIEFSVGETVYELAPGYSLLFEASIDHWFRNPGPEPAQLMLIFQANAGGQLAQRLHIDQS